MHLRFATHVTCKARAAAPKIRQNVLFTRNRHRDASQSGHPNILKRKEQNDLSKVSLITRTPEIWAQEDRALRQQLPLSPVGKQIKSKLSVAGSNPGNVLRTAIAKGHVPLDALGELPVTH